MGCLCPRKLPYAAPIATKKETRLELKPTTEQDFIVQSQRNKILPPTTGKSNLSKLQMFSQMNAQQPPERVLQERNDLNCTKTMPGKSFLSGIMISQLGGSKLQRNISIVSTEADVIGLNDSNFGSSRSMIQEMVVVTKGFEGKQKLKKIKKRYYTLIEGKLYLKKDPAIVTKIKSPSAESSLFCSLQTIRETIHVADGIPVENIKILPQQPLAYLVEDIYPLSISITFQCIRCKSRKLIASSSCKMKQNLKCKCGSAQFNIVEIETLPDRVPIWYEGQKLKSTKLRYTNNSQFRAIGCNICWKFQTCRPMDCGCLRCSICSSEHSDDKCILCL